MTGEGCGRADCLGCGLHGMGFDEDQVELVVQLMSNAYIFGGAQVAQDLVGSTAADSYGAARLARRGYLGIDIDSAQAAYRLTMARRSFPMSPDVADAVRQHG